MPISSLPAACASLCADVTTLRARSVKRPNPWLGFGRGLARVLRDEPLLRRLLADAHAAPDVGPRGPRAAGLVDEVPDQVVGHVVEVVRGDDRARQPFERIGMRLVDRLDQVVEPDGMGQLHRMRHASTLR